MRARILIADDDEVSCQLFAEVLQKEGYRADRARTGDDALARLREEVYDLLIVDVRMPGMTGLDVTQIAHTDYPSLPVIVMTAFGDIDTAVEAIREGAFDFISKPMNLEELKKTVSRALAQERPLSPSENNREEIEPGAQLGTVVGRSPAMVEVYKTIARAAPTKSTVLIFGESGTGKELFARAIHQHSLRASCPFVAVDCGALTETLLASELFGHVRGAFTGAVTDKKGVFEEAEGGTCFLDEIGDIGPDMQSKLLRVLQEHEVRRVGVQKWIKVDVRIIAATNKDLGKLAKAGAYREDLYYRLNVISICLPPLRERREDIPALARHFLKGYGQANGKRVAAISDEAMELLCAYSWPGNIRELENTIEQALVLSNQSMLTPDDLPLAVRQNTPSGPARNRLDGEPFHFSDTPSLEEVKKRYVLHVLSHAQGNISRAAKMLNIDRRSLYRMLARYNIAPFSSNTE
jgi:two-component system response regulator AtoC